MSSDGTRRVFVVHGRNADARDAMFLFLRALGLDPIEWDDAVARTGQGSPYIGDILDVAFRDAQAIVVLFTPDEVTYLRPEYASGEHDPECQPAPQARPNVLFEAGMAMGRDTKRTVLVELGTVRPFSDALGRHMVRIDNSEPKRRDLAKRLETAGCPTDLAGTTWLTAGDFTPPPAPGAGLPLGRRVPSTPPTRVSIDLRYHDVGKSGRLEIVNRGTEPVFDINLEIPKGTELSYVETDRLPIPRLPAGKSATLTAIPTRAMGPRRLTHFDILVTGRCEDGTEIRQAVFVDMGG